MTAGEHLTAVPGAAADRILEPFEVGSVTGLADGGVALEFPFPHLMVAPLQQRFTELARQ